MAAKKSRNAVMVCCTSEVGTARSFAMFGTDGRYASIEKGPSQARDARTKVRPTKEDALGSEPGLLFSETDIF
jgi:hypothetical protein